MNKKIRLVVIVLLSCFCCFASEKYDYEYFMQNEDEAMHYIFKIGELYDVLWDYSDEFMEKIDLDLSNKEYFALEKLDINKISPNGAYAYKLKIAEKRGLFKLLSKAYNAPKQHGHSVWNIKSHKPSCCVWAMRHILKYRILLDAEQERWDFVIYYLKIWLNVGLLSQEYPWSISVQGLMFGLLQKYDMPLKTLKEIIALNKLVVANPPGDPERKANDPLKACSKNMSIINIIIAKLLIYEKKGSFLPQKLSEIEGIKSYLKDLSIDIKYKKDGKKWYLENNSQVITKGNPLLPYKSLYKPKKIKTHKPAGIKL